MGSSRVWWTWCQMSASSGKSSRANLRMGVTRPSSQRLEKVAEVRFNKSLTTYFPVDLDGTRRDA